MKTMYLMSAPALLLTFSFVAFGLKCEAADASTNQSSFQASSDSSSSAARQAGQSYKANECSHDSMSFASSEAPGLINMQPPRAADYVGDVQPAHSQPQHSVQVRNQVMSDTQSYIWTK